MVDKMSQTKIHRIERIHKRQRKLIKATGQRLIDAETMVQSADEIKKILERFDSLQDKQHILVKELIDDAKV